MTSGHECVSGQCRTKVSSSHLLSLPDAMLFSLQTRKESYRSPISRDRHHPELPGQARLGARTQSLRPETVRCQAARINHRGTRYSEATRSRPAARRGAALACLPSIVVRHIRHIPSRLGARVGPSRLGSASLASCLAQQAPRCALQCAGEPARDRVPYRSCHAARDRKPWPLEAWVARTSRKRERC
jgi:hypothetical protein